MGFAFDKTYNSEKNIRERCMAKFESFINEFDSNKETDWMAWTVHFGIAKRSLKDGFINRNEPYIKGLICKN